MEERINFHFFQQVIGAVNKDAVAAQIARWIREDGISPETVKTMIDLFVENPANVKKGIPPWKSFLSRRQALLEAVQRTASDAEGKQRARDSEYWTGRSPVSTAPTSERKLSGKTEQEKT